MISVQCERLGDTQVSAGLLIAALEVQRDTVTTVAGYGDCLESRSIDALGKVTKSLTDGAGRTIQSIDQLNKVTNFTYDAGGNQLSVRDPNNVGQDVVYDVLGRAGLTTDTANATTNSTYDKAGNRIAAIDGKTKSTTYVFDARGRQKSQKDRNNGTTSFAYLATGQATYGIVAFTNDAAGRVLRKQDQKGDTCTMNYDLAGRLTSRNYRTFANSPSGTIADTDSFTYDKASRMLTAVSVRYVNTVTYTYDSAGRKKTEGLTISGQTYTTTTGYNAKGELTSYTYPDGTAVGRTYTARG
ncbi:MAG: hypothetical protein SFV81_11505, partial [Pirellulaceae bacterium]|nr:hypothetical protein [Pirellulaceae bacterium]